MEVLRPFTLPKDGIGAVTEKLVPGTKAEVPADAAEGLAKEGYARPVKDKDGQKINYEHSLSVLQENQLAAAEAAKRKVEVKVEQDAETANAARFAAEAAAVQGEVDGADAEGKYVAAAAATTAAVEAAAAGKALPGAPENKALPGANVGIIEPAPVRRDPTDVTRDGQDISEPRGLPSGSTPPGVTSVPAGVVKPATVQPAARPAPGPAKPAPGIRPTTK